MEKPLKFGLHRSRQGEMSCGERHDQPVFDKRALERSLKIR